MPVYAASEKPLKGGTTEDLAENFPAAGGPEVKNFHSLEKVWHDIKKELRAGDVLLIIGAGDIEQLAEWARR